MNIKDTADIIWIIVILGVAAGGVAYLPEPTKTKLAQLGGLAFLLYLLVQVGKFLFTHG